MNEAASGINLYPNTISENPEEGLLVGKLTALDEDVGQMHTFSLLDSAFGRFKLVNNSEIRTAVSNTKCRLYGGSNCLLDYEKQRVYTLRVRATDDGTPPLKMTADVNITLHDINDRPRGLSLSKSWILENATVNTSVGNFIAYDEDGDLLNYTLVRGGNPLFQLESNGRLFVANALNHEKSSIEHLTVRVADIRVNMMFVSTRLTRVWKAMWKVCLYYLIINHRYLLYTK